MLERVPTDLRRLRVNTPPARARKTRQPAAYLVLAGLFGLVAVTGCKTSAPDTHRKAEAPAALQSATSAATEPSTGSPDAVGRHFGEQTRKDIPSARLADVLAAPAQYQGRTLTLEGNVRRVCQRKGCWMELAEGSDGKLPGCRVTFRDYGFFVPTDSAGARARVQAEVQVEQISKAAVDHMEHEGAAFADKQPDGTAREVRLVASAVDLYR